MYPYYLLSDYPVLQPYFSFQLQFSGKPYVIVNIQELMDFYKLFTGLDEGKAPVRGRNALNSGNLGKMKDPVANDTAAAKEVRLPPLL